MDAREFYESMLITDANSAVDTNKTKFSRFELWKFAEAYHHKATTNTVIPVDETLVDFFRWLNEYEELKYTPKGIRFYVDEYLKRYQCNNSPDTPSLG
jgi:hypothetical protein